MILILKEFNLIILLYSLVVVAVLQPVSQYSHIDAIPSGSQVETKR